MQDDGTFANVRRRRIANTRPVESPRRALVMYRRGDRVVIRTVTGKILAKELNRQTASKVEVRSLNSDEPVISFAPK